MSLFHAGKTHGGAHVPHFKNTHESVTVKMPPPEKVVIPMSQHIGACCAPTVKVGDEVFVGTLIGDSESYVSAPIHASVSGKVTAVSEIMMPSGTRVPAVTILSDGEMTPDPACKPPVIESREDFFRAARDCGLVGLGGAGFPTHVKMNAKNLDEIDTIVVNGAECEPFITSDYRAFMEDTDAAIAALQMAKKYLEVKQVFIGIETNKPKAIDLFNHRLKEEDDVSVIPLPQRYPQGAEKVIIRETTGRVVPEGKLPGDVGVLVFNITSLACLGKYLLTGMPLVEKRLTIDGGAVREAKNVFVPIGTRISDIAEFCGGYKQQPAKILMGGPMMGIALYGDDFPILKNNNAILLLSEQQAKKQPRTACIRCSRCVNACPMQLMPAELERAYEARDLEALKAHKAMLCMECGTCSFVCPAKRELVQSIRLGKGLLRSAQQK